MKYYIRYTLLFVHVLTSTFVLNAQTNDTIKNEILRMAIQYEGIQDSLYVSPNLNPAIGDNEYVESTIWLPGADKAIIPYNVIFINNKSYVYGDRQILEINPQTNQVVESLKLIKR